MTYTGTTRMPEQYCPHCGYLFDEATPADQENLPTPKPEDLTVCLRCRTALRWDHRMQLHVLTRADLDALPADILLTLLRTQRAVRSIQVQQN
jgi:rubredoxin